ASEPLGAMAEPTGPEPVVVEVMSTSEAAQAQRRGEESAHELAGTKSHCLPAHAGQLEYVAAPAGAGAMLLANRVAS
ncbi:hypothetical protein L9G74_20700, partial [Shewanella sp. C32]|nr:hypothetical protein [Shewanella electrica]